MSFSIIKYDPNDYKLGDSLSLAGGEVITGTQKLAEVFSLYFQWKSKALCWCYTSKDKSDRFSAQMSYDEEERVATQFYVETANSNKSHLNEWSFLRLEIFDNCFEFESKLLDIFDDNGKTVAIIDVPTEVRVIKNRRYPRVAASSPATIDWISSDSTKQFNIHSISLNSIIVTGFIPSGTTGKLRIENQEFEATATRNFNDLSSLQVRYSNNTDIGKWFDYYCKHAYPNLRKRSAVPVSECINLYKESGYFEKYKATDFEDHMQEIQAAWKQLESIEHVATADYVITSANRAVGIGSSSYTYQEGEKEVWTFHSLCALKNDDDLDRTRALYAWRAEYNFSRLEDIDTLLFFASQSRWIERVYVNFLLRKSQSSVNPVRIYTITYQPKDHDIATSKKFLSDSMTRLTVDLPEIAAAALPDHIHIRKKLNCIVLKSEDVSEETVQSVGEQLAFAAGREVTFRVSIPSNHRWHPELEQDLPTDRLGILKKNDLIDFIASLTHSIEVTKRKKNLA